MVVIFYKTTETGQKEAGRILYNGRTLQATSEQAGHLMDTLLQGVDRTKPDQVEKALRSAPQRYTGSYMRAAFEEDDTKEGIENVLIQAALKGGPGSGNWAHISETRRGVGRGGSDPGGGLSAIGAAPESTPRERHTASHHTRNRRRVATAVPRFKSNQEAADWIVAQGYAEECFFKKFDTRMCQDIADSLHDNMQRVPALKGRITRIGNNRELNAKLRKEKRAEFEKQAEKYYGTGNPRYQNDPARYDKYKEDYIKRKMRRTGYRMGANGWAIAVGDQFYVSQKWGSHYEDFQASSRRCVKNGWHPPGTEPIRSIIDHELGHNIDTMLSISKDHIVRGVIQDAYKTKSVPSRYARENYKEFVAESWAEYLNSPSPRPVATAIGRQIEELSADHMARRRPRS